jgi:two-component system, chemotaxis family, CheB/CheR fusion protein
VSTTTGEVSDNATVAPLRVVAIGASAGGLEALEQFFAAMPSNTGFAFVVIQHLAPDFKSMMDELLRRHTHMPVVAAENNLALAGDTLYLIPPRVDMIVSSGRLLLSERDTSAGLNLPIDLFFRSLASDFGSAAVGIVLSGTGSDGSRGVMSIHEAGGMVIVQDPETATFDGMPNSALATGCADVVVAPDQMAAHLLRTSQAPVGREIDFDADGFSDDPAQVETYEAVFRILSEEHGVDFHQYKLSTIARRIERRVRLRGCRAIDDYVRLLNLEQGEVADLYADLLIGVTEFFRDGPAWDALRDTVLPRLIDELPIDQELRCWVAGTASGQEAYSLAIVVHEAAAALGRVVNARIFATDLHKASIEYSRARGSTPSMRSPASAPNGASGGSTCATTARPR